MAFGFIAVLCFLYMVLTVLRSPVLMLLLLILVIMACH
jgi:hypothetical protein